MTETRAFPAHLWHYTTGTGLLGILSTKSLWATHIGYLNDATEFQHAVVVLDSAAKAKYPEAELTRVGWGQVLTEISTRLWDVKEEELKSTYLTSFSAAEDLLSMWRAYPGGHTGYALCFDPSSFPPSCIDWPGRLVRCLYEEGEKEAELRAALHRLEKLLAIGGTPAKEQRDRTAREISLDLQAVSPQFKHPHFREEREWRLVCRASSDGLSSKLAVSFRAGQSTLIPHISMPLERCGKSFGLLAVMVGPGPNQLQSAMALEMMLKAHGISHVSVKRSSVPLRTV